MTRALALLALAACGHHAAVSGPENDLDVARPVASGSAAAPSAPPVAAKPASVPALTGDGPHAFVADANGLVEVAASGKSQQIVAAKPSWCSADARARVVWFRGDDGLYAFDLDDRAVHAIVRAQLDADTVTIDWGNERLGGEDKLAYQVALGVRMAKATLSSELGCDGDEAVYCYDDDGRTLRAELVERQKKLDALEVADPAYLAALAARGRERSLWTPPPVPPVAPARKPKVDRKACEEDAARCGRLVAIPASPLWLVVTANSRGDFYHETRELWDPSTGEFLAVSGAQLARAPRPQQGDTDYRDLRVATSGLLSIDGVVFDPAHVVYAPSGDVPLTCGWSDGGWRMPSPTE